MKEEGRTDVLRPDDGLHDERERLPAMITHALSWTPAGARMTTFSRGERRTLRALRDRYQQDHDLFSAQELAYLRFVRWLYHTGRLVP